MHIDAHLDDSETAEILMNRFLHASARAGTGSRDTWLARQAMLSILRLARCEQLLAIRCSVKQLVPDHLRSHSIKSNRRKRVAGSLSGQTQFVFGRDDLSS